MDTSEVTSCSFLQCVPRTGEIDAVEERRHLQHCNGGWGKDKERAGSPPAAESPRLLQELSGGAAQAHLRAAGLSLQKQSRGGTCEGNATGNTNKSDLCKLLEKMLLQVFWIPNWAALQSHWIRGGFLGQKIFSSQPLQTNTVGIPKGSFSPRFEDQGLCTQCSQADGPCG